MKVPQFRSFVDKSDYKAIERVFEDRYIAEGSVGKEFTEELLKLIRSDYGVLASNGTLALYLALKSLGIGAGDEVIVQDMTFIATANAVEMVGAKPIFVDILEHNDPSLNVSKIRITPNTKAVMVAHLFGTACSNIEEIVEFCKLNKIFLIEDAAQSISIQNETTHCGNFGDIGTFSFFADKTITTGEGGFVVTKSVEIYEKMQYLRNQGRKQSGSFVHPEIGFNFRLTDIQSALGLSQLSKLNTIIEAKSTLYRKYTELLEDKVEFLKIRSDFSHIPFRVVIFVDDADRTMNKMNEFGVEPRSVFYPLHKQPCYSKYSYSDGDFEKSNSCFNRGICLPTWIGISDAQIEHVVNSLIKSL